MLFQIVQKVADLQDAISEGATSFLFTEYKYMGVFMVSSCFPPTLHCLLMPWNNLAAAVDQVRSLSGDSWSPRLLTSGLLQVTVIQDK